MILLNYILDRLIRWLISSVLEPTKSCPGFLVHVGGGGSMISMLLLEWHRAMELYDVVCLGT